MSLLQTSLLGLLGLTGATQVLAARREARAAKLSPPKGQDVEVEGRRVQVEVQGSAGPDLVLIHGSSGNTRDFTFRLADELAGRYRVFVVDRPGLGWSDPVKGGDGLEAQARAIQKAVAALGAKCPIVLGQSYGGAVALTWGATLPGTACALVPVSGVAYPWSTGLGWYYSMLSHPFGRALVIPLITAFTPRALIKAEINKVFAPQSAPPGFAAYFGPELTVRRAQMRTNARQRRALLGEITRLSPRWREIEVPIEAIHGDCDPIVHHGIHSERLAEEVAQARVTILPGIGHMPHHVARAEVIAAVDRAALRADVK